MTSSSHSTPNAAAEEAAARWAARLDGSTLSADARDQLDAWLDQDPAHRGLLSDYCQLSADLEQTLPLVAIPQSSVRSCAGEGGSRRRRRRRVAVVAAMAAAAAVAVLLFPRDRTAVQFERLATPVSQRQDLTLADGTRVELNAQTSLVVDLGRVERRVRLAGGEAFFDVRSDPARPFIVETPGGAVRVTGTDFNVRSTPAAFEVLVVEGAVQVRPAGANGPATGPVNLVAGQRLSAGSAGVALEEVSAQDREDLLAWRQGQVVFRGTALRDALERFAHYHGRGLAATPGAAAERIGGRYSLDDLDGFLATLEEVLPVRVAEDLSGNVQVRLRSEP